METPNATGGLWRTSNLSVLNDFSIWPKTNTNQQQPKSEAKAITRKEKVQEWFGESAGLGKAYRTLKGLFFINGSSLDDLVFPAVRKRKKLGKRHQQLKKWEPDPFKIVPRGSLGGASGVKAAAGGEGNPKIQICDTHWIAFGAFSIPIIQKWAPFWAPLNFEGVPK